jgi:hypothetical protein
MGKDGTQTGKGTRLGMVPSSQVPNGVGARFISPP